jgi:hypothetical protein
VVTAPVFTINDYLWMAYVAGAVVLLLFLVVKLYSVFKLTQNNKAAYGKYKMVYLKDTDVAFSFFNYLFIGTRAAGANTIITHELVHIRQKHSADIMFLELLKVICWFNPCIYLLQKSLKTVHEYIADEQTAATEADALTYSSFLVNNAYGAGGSSITHSFFNYNLLKKRIIMLNQQRSGKLARLKYLIAVPVCAGLLCASTLGFSKNYGWIDLSPLNSVKSNAAAVKLNIPLADTLISKKGYKYTEAFYTKNGFKACTVTFYEADGKKSSFNSNLISASTINLLTDKYGYIFPNGTMPPPPPKPKVDQIKFPPPVVKSKKTDVVKFPPPAVKVRDIKLSPPPPEPPKPKVDQVKFPPPIVRPNADNTVTGQTKITSKRYVYEEGAIIADKKGDMFVIIYEKNGDRQAPIYRSSATPEQISTLLNKYGYKFPDLKVYPEMPPPPPPIPPVAQPAKPTGSLLNKRNSNGGNATKAALKNVVMEASNGKRRFLPLIIVNNQRYTLSKELQDRYANGEGLVFSATDSTATYVRNTPYAISKWGPDAAEGVVTLFGKTSITTTK